MDHFIDTKIPKLGIFVDKNSQNDQTPFPKVGRKTPETAKMFVFCCKTVREAKKWRYAMPKWSGTQYARVEGGVTLLQGHTLPFYFKDEMTVSTNYNCLHLTF